jgi:hypothetical protein
VGGDDDERAVTDVQRRTALLSEFPSRFNPERAGELAAPVDGGDVLDVVRDAMKALLTGLHTRRVESADLYVLIPFDSPVLATYAPCEGERFFAISTISRTTTSKSAMESQRRCTNGSQSWSDATWDNDTTNSEARPG